MKLATDADLLPNRNALHKYMTQPGSCTKCGGMGWFPAENEDVYCDCAAGKKRQEVERAP